MAERYEVKVTIKSARDLKNINWKHGDLRPYAVVWIDQGKKYSTKVDFDKGENPVWDEKLEIKTPEYKRIEDCSLFVDIVHDDPRGQLTKKIVGSGKLSLLDVLADANNAGKATQFIKLVRPSGRPQGKLEVKVSVKKLARYEPYPPTYNPTPARPPTYNPTPVPPPTYGYPYNPSPVYGGSATAPPPPTYGYGSSQGYTGSGSGYVSIGEPVRTSKAGLGAGLAVGAAAGLLGGLVLAEGVEHFEDKVAEKAARKVEEDHGCYYDGGSGGGGSYYQPDSSSYQPDDDWSF